MDVIVLSETKQDVSDIKGKRLSNPDTDLRGLEGSGRLRLPEF
jgi:hypothetical protein